MSNIVPIKPTLDLGLSEKAQDDINCIMLASLKLKAMIADERATGREQRALIQRQVASALELFSRGGEKILKALECRSPHLVQRFGSDFVLSESDGVIEHRAHISVNAKGLVIEALEFQRDKDAPAGFRLHHALADLRRVQDCPYSPDPAFA